MSKARNLSALLSADGKVEADDLDVGQIGGRRNLLINGGFDIWQRGTSHSNITGGYTADRWNFSAASAGSVSYANDSVYGNIARLTLGSTDTNFVQPIENLNGFINNKTLTLSFWVKSSTITSARCVAYNGSGFTHDVPYTVTSSWSKVSLTFQTGGSYVAGNPYRVYLLRRPNATGVIEFAQVQLEVGDTATPFEHRSYGEELVLCQRYYRGNSQRIHCQNGANGSWNNADYSFSPQMRASPSIALTENVGSITIAQGAINGTVEGFHAYAGSVTVGAHFRFTADAEL